MVQGDATLRSVVSLGKPSNHTFLKLDRFSLSKFTLGFKMW